MMMMSIIDDDNVWGEILLNLDFVSAQRFMEFLCSHSHSHSHSNSNSQNDDNAKDDHDENGHVVSLLPVSSFGLKHNNPTTKNNYNKKFRHVWKMLYNRHFFSPIDSAASVTRGNFSMSTNGGEASARGDDRDLYWKLTLERRQLLSNLFQDEKTLKMKQKPQKKQQKNMNRSKSSRSNSSSNSNSNNIPDKARTRCFNLPNRYFHFKPIVPTELLLEQKQEGLENDQDEEEEFSSSPSSVSWINGYLTDQQQHHRQHDDQRRNSHIQQPPVVFECDSFVLTSPGVAGELVFLDPFDGRLQVLRDIKTHCVANDEAMMEHAMVQATKAILVGASDSSHGNGKTSKNSAVKTTTKSIPIQKHVPDDSSVWNRSSTFLGSNNNNNNDYDAEIAGAAIDESIYQNHAQSTRLHDADTQELLSENEYFTFDVTPYFVDDGSHNNNNIAGRQSRLDGHHRNRHNVVGGGSSSNGGNNGSLHPAFDEDEFDLCYVGVDARPIMEFDEYINPTQNHETHSSSSSSSYSSSRITGFMAAVGRTVTSINHDDIVCSELTVWKRKNIAILDNEEIKKQNNDEGSTNNNQSYYKTKLVCRFRSNLELVDFDPRTDRAFVLKSGGHILDSSRGHMNHQSTTTTSITNTTATTTTNRRRRSKMEINIFPIIECDDDDESDDDIDRGHHDGLDSVPTTKYFPTPLATVCCDGQPRCFAVDGTGKTLVIGTDAPAIEVWDVQCNKEPRRKEVLDVRKALCKSIKDFLDIVHRVCDGDRRTLTNSRKSDTDAASTSDLTTSSRSEGNEDTPDVSLVALKRQPNLPHICAPVDSIFVPKHLPAVAAGFVTLHYSRDEGSSLILWRYIGKPGRKELKPSSTINLRLSSRRKPRVTYDGNRIIVLGEDHIGVIILVYQVSNGNEPFPVETDFDAMTCEHSGGVYNLTSPPQIRFRNRIRHVALGGINRSDTLHLTSNERFIIVNTKTGDLLTGASFPFSEGLLVIDLQDESMGRKFQ